jgi:hypothetical protein
MAKHKHKVRTHTWVSGLLRTIDEHFESLEEAHDFASSIKAHVVKIFDDNGELVVSRSLNIEPEQVNVSYSGIENGYSYPQTYA